MLGLILQPDDITQESNIIYSSGTAWVQEAAVSLGELQSC